MKQNKIIKKISIFDRIRTKILIIYIPCTVYIYRKRDPAAPFSLQFFYYCYYYYYFQLQPKSDVFRYRSIFKLSLFVLFSFFPPLVYRSPFLTTLFGFLAFSISCLWQLFCSFLISFCHRFGFVSFFFFDLGF